MLERGGRDGRPEERIKAVQDDERGEVLSDFGTAFVDEALCPAAVGFRRGGLTLSPCGLEASGGVVRLIGGCCRGGRVVSSPVPGCLKKKK